MATSLAEFNFELLPKWKIYELFPKQKNPSLVIAYHGFINNKQILIHDYDISYSDPKIKLKPPVLGEHVRASFITQYMLAIIGFNKQKYSRILGPKFCIEKIYDEPGYVNSPEYGPILNSLRAKTLLAILNKLENSNYD